MSYTPRDPELEDAPTSPIPAARGGRDSADEPVTGAPAGAAGASGSAEWILGGSPSASDESGGLQSGPGGGGPQSRPGGGPQPGPGGSDPASGWPAGGGASAPIAPATAWTVGGGSGLGPGPSNPSSAWSVGGGDPGSAPGESGSAAWTAGPAAGAGDPDDESGPTDADGPTDAGDAADAGDADSTAATTQPADPGTSPPTKRRVLRLSPIPTGPEGERQRRRRRWFVIGIAVAAAIVVGSLCAGAVSVVSTIDDARDRAAEARDARLLRDTECLDLERRLNRLTPPGATTGPAVRATAIRNENAAVRIYVDRLDDQRAEDAWRQLLDARTVFADALDRQATARTPAFYVAPRTTDGQAVTDELAQWSPATCAGPIRRLAAPEL